MSQKFNAIDLAVNAAEINEDMGEEFIEEAPAKKPAAKKPAAKKPAARRKPNLTMPTPVGQKKPVPVKKPVVEVLRQNGLAYPHKDTVSGKFWAMCDAAAKSKDGAVRNEIIKAAVESSGINKATASTQYARWKKFNGV